MSIWGGGGCCCLGSTPTSKMFLWTGACLRRSAFGKILSSPCTRKFFKVQTGPLEGETFPAQLPNNSRIEVFTQMTQARNGLDHSLTRSIGRHFTFDACVTGRAASEFLTRASNGRQIQHDTQWRATTTKTKDQFSPFLPSRQNFDAASCVWKPRIATRLTLRGAEVGCDVAAVRVRDVDEDLDVLEVAHVVLLPRAASRVDGDDDLLPPAEPPGARSGETRREHEEHRTMSQGEEPQLLRGVFRPHTHQQTHGLTHELTD